MLTQLWGCKHPERPRAQGATCRHAFCPARGSCWHWPPGSVCCRAPGRAPWRWWQEPAVEHRRLPAVHTAPLPSRRTANAVPHVLPARLPERTFLLATPARGARARLLPRLLIADPAPQYAVAVRFRPGNFKSFNSLSRVLFIFRSRYLFAIGLGRAILQLRKPWLGSLSAVFTLHS